MDLSSMSQVTAWRQRQMLKRTCSRSSQAVTGMNLQFLDYRPTGYSTDIILQSHHQSWGGRFLRWMDFHLKVYICFEEGPFKTKHVLECSQLDNKMRIILHKIVQTMLIEGRQTKQTEIIPKQKCYVLKYQNCKMVGKHTKKKQMQCSTFMTTTLCTPLKISMLPSSSISSTVISA